MTKASRYSKKERIGDWKLEQELGAGGQGEVWKVRHSKERHSPPGALKICTNVDAKAVARFTREWELLRDTSHVGLVAVRDIGEHEGAPFFVMDLATTSMEDVLKGATTGTRLLRESPGLLLRFFRQACEAVAHLHAKEILHRDIKPANVLLMLDPPEPMRAVMADLGIASAIAEQGTLTATQEVVGTPVYRAPESMLPGGHVKASDVYSLGKTLKAIIGGRTPVEIVPPPLPQHPGLAKDLWRALDAVIAKACAHSPDARYPDAAALLVALPLPVLAAAHSTTGVDPIPGDIALSSAAVETLAHIIGACPAEHDAVMAQSLSNDTLLQKYDLSMGLRELHELKFCVTVEYDVNGDTWNAIRPTPAGYQWARMHPGDMQKALSKSRNQVVDDDIPF